MVTKQDISRRAIVILVCVYIIILAKSRSPEYKDVQPHLQKKFSKLWTNVIVPRDNITVSRDNVSTSRDNVTASREKYHALRQITSARDDAINSYRPHIGKPEVTKLYSYDIAIISMSARWYRAFSLPREIRCHSNSSSSAVIRKASVDEDSIKHADILIFAGKILSYHEWTKLQGLRHSKQLWVHTTEESPFNSLFICPPRDMNIHFNVSFTYHPEADISVPYGQFIPFKQQQVVYIKSSFNKKTKLIAWVSSHCSTMMWRRLDFAKDLAKYLPVDIYGSCGTLSCPKHQKKCEKIFQSYKFYLAMENSCCGGYITEKFWKALSHFEAIPVVVGAPKTEYEKRAPKNSFIHADDFGSMKKLADYILMVSNSKKLYDSYFHWKLSGTVTSNQIVSIMAFTDSGVCRLIEYVDTLGERSHTISSLNFYGLNWVGGCNECGEKEWLRNYSNFQYDVWIEKKMRQRF